MHLLGWVQGPVVEQKLGDKRVFAFDLVEKIRLLGEPETQTYRVWAVIDPLLADLLTDGFLFEVQGYPLALLDGQGKPQVVIRARHVAPRDPWELLLALYMNEYGYGYWDARPEEFWEAARAKREQLLIERAGGVLVQRGKVYQGDAPANPLAQVMLGLDSAALGAHVPELANSIRTPKSRLADDWALTHNVGLMSSVLGPRAFGEEPDAAPAAPLPRFDSADYTRLEETPGPEDLGLD